MEFHRRRTFFLVNLQLILAGATDGHERRLWHWLQAVVKLLRTLIEGRRRAFKERLNFLQIQLLNVAYQLFTFGVAQLAPEAQQMFLPVPRQRFLHRLKVCHLSAVDEIKFGVMNYAKRLIFAT